MENEIINAAIRALAAGIRGEKDYLYGSGESSPEKTNEQEEDEKNEKN